MNANSPTGAVVAAAPRFWFEADLEAYVNSRYQRPKYAEWIFCVADRYFVVMPD